MPGLVSSDRLEPGESAEISFVLDPIGKSGNVRKTIKIITNDPEWPKFSIAVLALVDHSLDVDATVPLEQTLFGRDECARCHSKPAGTLTGVALYDKICEMCHGPIDEYALGLPRTLMETEQLRQWVAVGRGAGGMPGYATAQGGPLTDAQVDSLVDLMLTEGQ